MEIQEKGIERPIEAYKLTRARLSPRKPQKAVAGVLGVLRGQL